MAKAKERKVFAPTEQWYLKRESERKFQWVALDDGAEVCVWASRVKEALSVAAGATRPSAFTDGQETIDNQAAMIQSLIISCHDGEPPDGQPVFSLEKLWAIHALSLSEWHNLLSAQAKVNGEGVADRLGRFIDRAMAEGSAPSATGALKNSPGSRKS